MPNVQVYGNATDTSIYYVYAKEKSSLKKPVPLSAAAIQYLMICLKALLPSKN
jgi:hypothetical protein